MCWNKLRFIILFIFEAYDIHAFWLGTQFGSGPHFELPLIKSNYLLKDKRTIKHIAILENYFLLFCIKTIECISIIKRNCKYIHAMYVGAFG